MNPYVILLKPRVIWLLILSAVAGYIYSAPSVNLHTLAALLVVAFLSTGGSAAFNHYWERDIDALMSRTAGRPLPRGLVKPSAALVFSLAFSTLGVALAFLWLNLLAAVFVTLGWVFYSLVYTVLLKRRTWLNVLAGGFAGNFTFLGGYALGMGTVDLLAVLISFAIYLWIPSHIWALAYKHRDDYIKANVPMLSTVVSPHTAVSIISLMNIASAIYVVGLYLALSGLNYPFILVAAGAAAAVYTSVLALVEKNDVVMWRMYKASSPVLTLFLLALILAKL